MFLLIMGGMGMFLPFMFNFNTSHVSINPFIRWYSNFSYIISIHLMFLLIRGHKGIDKSPNCISIHLMFLLIRLYFSEPMGGNNFNTSHVSINQKCWILWQALNGISIHLMFLLITKQKSTANYTAQFQYISCFY